ncbi:hypothetical protein HGG76_16005 [Ochrobactrum tritici]|uniref:Uncharacterized protein n=1 Tax=Brucella tritici TaxID=94626 RepID=A0A7X6JAX7_9HYPH|nr:hypothetical protein [Brucella tritici]
MNHNDENAAHFDAAAFWLDMIVQFIRDLPAREGEVSEAAQLMIDITRVMADLKNGTGEAQAFVDNPASFDAAMLKTFRHWKRWPKIAGATIRREQSNHALISTLSLTPIFLLRPKLGAGRVDQEGRIVCQRMLLLRASSVGSRTTALAMEALLFQCS